MTSTETTTSTDTTTSNNTITSTDTTISPDTSTSESCEFQFPGLFESLSPEMILSIMEHFDVESSVVLMLLSKALAYFFLENSWNILCLSENKKPAKELVQFVTRVKDMKTRVPVLCSPGILGLYKGFQINAVIITSTHDSFPECSLSDVSSMVIHLPQIPFSNVRLAEAHSQFLESLPIDKFSSLKSLMLERVLLTQVLFSRIGNLKVEEMHWNYVYAPYFKPPVPTKSLASVKRFYGRYSAPPQYGSHRFFPFAEKMVIHSTFESQKIQKCLSVYRFDLSESKSLQYL
jgi:hypothetical protein